MAVLSNELAAYEDMRDHLETDHFGQWVVLHDEKLAGTYGSFEAAAEDAVRRFGRGPYLIRQVGAPPLTLPRFTFPAWNGRSTGDSPAFISLKAGNLTSL